MHGFYIFGGYDIVVTNLNCDNNGFNWAQYTYPTPPVIKAIPDSFGVMMESALNCTILGYNFSNRSVSYKYGVGAYKVWNGSHSGNFASQKIRIQLNDERNPYGVSVDSSADGIDLFQDREGVSTEEIASFTLSAAKFGTTMRINSASDVTVTVPNEATCIAGNIPRRSNVTRFILNGTGRLIFAAESGVSFYAITTTFSTRYTVVDLIRTHTDRWTIHGTPAIGLGTALPATTGTVSITMDGSVKALVPTGNITLNATGMLTGREVTLLVTTSGTTSYTITFGTNFISQGVLTTGVVSGKTFAIKFMANGTTCYEVGARGSAM